MLGKKQKYVSKHAASPQTEKRASKTAEPEKRAEVSEKRNEEPVWRAAKKSGPKSSIKLVLIIVIILAVLAAAVIIAGSIITKSDKNLPKMTVGDIDIGGLTKEQTRQKLIDEGWEAKITQPLVVTTIGDLTVDVDLIESGTMLSVDDAVENAHSYGHSGSIVKNLFAYLADTAAGVDINKHSKEMSQSYIDKCVSEAAAKIDEYMGTEPYSVDLENSALDMKKGVGELKLDEQGMKAAIQGALEQGRTELTYKEILKELTMPDFNQIHSDLGKESRDASYTDDNKFDVIDEIVGCKFDVANAQQIWSSAQPGELITVPLDITWPKVTGEELRNRLFHDLLGAMTTEFPASGPDRVSNVNLCASKVNGTILSPGDIFSYNDLVGPRTKEAGFLVAPAYVDGEVKDELGGGACQVSSTTYAATLFAFLETVDRTCHQFPVSYMQMGTDATVAWPEDGTIVDFKFKNNKNYPVKVLAMCDTENKTITVEIWGTLEDGDYMPVEFDNRYSWVNTYYRDIEPAYEGRDAYIIRLTHDIYTEEDCTKSQTHRRVFDMEGNEVADEVVNMKLKNGLASMDTYYTHP